MTDETRIDKWLWAARFFKSRSLAADAVSGGKVHLNGARTKASKLVHPGDELTVRRGSFETVLVVRMIAEKRGSAPEAARLYEETQASKERRAELAAELRAQGAPLGRTGGRPSKRDRRAVIRLTRGPED